MRSTAMLIRESTSSPIPALIARRRRTTLGVGIRIILAGPRLYPDVPRRVADLPLIVEPGECGLSCQPARVVNLLTARALRSLHGLWYREKMSLSTRIRLAPAIFIGLLVFFSAYAWADTGAHRTGSDGADALPPGALNTSPSPYLRGAAGEPIRWQPWAATTFALAHRLKRPLLIDIGAGWCHWCHVMDDTTYADPQVVAKLNSSFVPVKVDMDVRPDVDSFYQNAAARLTGAGGWPLTCLPHRPERCFMPRVICRLCGSPTARQP